LTTPNIDKSINAAYKVVVVRAVLKKPKQ